ncbi:MAG: phosphoglucosamine mutase [Geminicoccaceae bacterium]|nr:MAG: phosphoglucosamine mutase [Geminicoccaceae bacterium]
MGRKLFGTDGIRGMANQHPMTCEIALKLGYAAGAMFARGKHRNRVVIGKDTRRSGYMLEPALTAGFVAAGMDVTLLGPLPTPAVAYLTPSLRCELGVMISASHNGFADNGIKLFGADGYKLSDEIEEELEARMAAAPELADSLHLGRVDRLEGAQGRYIEALKASFPRERTLAGLKVVVDCAHGAAYRVAPKILWELGAEVIEIGTEPDGFNINLDCGSTAPTQLRQRVIGEGADVGIALDGDADRCILVDETGQIVDGDQLIAMIARCWHERGRLQGGGVVVTQMSNLGLERFLDRLGLQTVRTKVGDRYVVEAMRTGGFNVGGEQSGHIILGDYATTGDGLLATLQVLAVMVEAQGRLSELARQFKPLPQRLRNLRVPKRPDLSLPAIASAIADGEHRLNGSGRLLVRPSGTEPLVRVMVEAEDEALLAAVLDEVSDRIQAAL